MYRFDAERIGGMCIAEPSAVHEQLCLAVIGLEEHRRRNTKLLDVNAACRSVFKGNEVLQIAACEVTVAIRLQLGQEPMDMIQMCHIMRRLFRFKVFFIKEIERQVMHNHMSQFVADNETQFTIRQCVHGSGRNAYNAWIVIVPLVTGCRDIRAISKAEQDIATHVQTFLNGLAELVDSWGCVRFDGEIKPHLVVEVEFVFLCRHIELGWAARLHNFP